MADVHREAAAAPAARAADAVAAAIEERGADPRQLIEVLHAIQPIEGHLSRRTLHQVACGLRLPLSHVVGVASFYHLFALSPPAPHRLAVCGGTACFVQGAAPLQSWLGELLAIPGGRGRRGDWELLVCGCLAACGSQPVLRLDDGTVIAVGPQRRAALRRRLQHWGAPLAPGAAAAAAVPPGDAARCVRGGEAQ